MTQAQSNTSPSDAQTHALAGILQLQQRAMSASSLAELRFIIINETFNFHAYRQAAFFEQSLTGIHVTAASGLVDVETISPFSVWLNTYAKQFSGLKQATRFDFAQATAEQQEQWQEWLPEHILVIPLLAREQSAYVLYARDTVWTESEIEQLAFLHLSYRHCYQALIPKKPSVDVKALLANKKHLGYAALATLLILCFPVRMSVLAPAEVIALNALNLASPQDGVIKEILVKPNQMVKADDVVFTLDDTSNSNRIAVARKALDTAKAEALVAEQRAFNDEKSRADLAATLGRVREKEAELQAAESLQSRLGVLATENGIAVFGDENDWIGRPVQTGERVMQIANPKDAGLLIWLPTHDAIAFEKEAHVKLFLDTDPLNPVDASLIQTSYQAGLSPNGVASYRLKAEFNAGEQLPRIGLQGTARIAGERSTLAYYIFRRPITAIRGWLGW